MEKINKNRMWKAGPPQSAPKYTGLNSFPCNYKNVFTNIKNILKIGRLIALKDWAIACIDKYKFI